VKGKRIGRGLYERFGGLQEEGGSERSEEGNGKTYLVMTEVCQQVKNHGLHKPRLGNLENDMVDKDFDEDLADNGALSVRSIVLGG